jgi:hypothetical protein
MRSIYLIIILILINLLIYYLYEIKDKTQSFYNILYNKFQSPIKKIIENIQNFTINRPELIITQPQPIKYPFYEYDPKTKSPLIDNKYINDGIEYGKVSKSGKIDLTRKIKKPKPFNY